MDTGHYRELYITKRRKLMVGRWMALPIEAEAFQYPQGGKGEKSGILLNRRLKIYQAAVQSWRWLILIIIICNQMD